MLETGQPLLVYDYDKLQSKEIIVRPASEKEKISVTNGKELSLSSEDTVISIKKEIISLAGIINSQIALVDNKTTDILIESSRFSPESIEKTAQHLSISNLASQYLSKKTNLSFGDCALRRAIELIEEIHPTKGKAKIISWHCMTTKKIITPRIISINLEFIEKKLWLKIIPADL
jgi:phenylalanyl-tRNA synthetase beta chain